MILSRQHAYGRPIEYRVGELVVSFKSTFRSTERGTGIGGMFAMGDDLSYDYDDDRSFFNGSTGPSSMHGHSMHGRNPLPLSLGSGSSGFPTSSKPPALFNTIRRRITMCLHRYWFISSSTNTNAAIPTNPTSQYLPLATTTIATHATYEPRCVLLSPSYQWTYWCR